MESTITIPKKGLSEISLRKALYLFTEHCTWTLSSSDQTWLITIPKSDDTFEIRSTLDCLVNDQILRETLSNKTRDLKSRIIQKALTDIESSI